MFTIMPNATRHTIPAMPRFPFAAPAFRPFFDSMSEPLFRVDILEADDAYTIEADLPGVKQEDIHLSVHDDILTVTADINSAHEDDSHAYCERRSGHMERSFSLEGIRQEDITAISKNGVLTINLPKETPTVKPEPREITVRYE